MKCGDPVVVRGLYLGTVDGEGVYQYVIKEGPNKGKYAILAEGMLIPIEPERIVWTMKSQST